MSDDSEEQTFVDSIRAARNTRWLGRPLHYHPALPSTNDALTKMARDGAPTGTMVITDYQSQGRGRMGRRWLAPASTSLLFSLLFRPTWTSERMVWLTMLAGLAAIRAIKSLSNLSPLLKWPNDLVLPAGNQWRKFGGMLLEGQLVDGSWEAAIIGIGINVNIEPNEMPAAAMPATSLLKESGQTIDRALLLGELLAELEKGYDAADQGQSPREEWRRMLVTIGQRVTVSLPGNRFLLNGIAVGTDEWGRLIVHDDSGQEHAVSAGDVTLHVDNSRD